MHLHYRDEVGPSPFPFRCPLMGPTSLGTASGAHGLTSPCTLFRHVLNGNIL
jgi:hypothetical protein